MYLLIFKAGWQSFAMIFILGSLYLTFENLDMYARMDAELERRAQCENPRLLGAGAD